MTESERYIDVLIATLQKKISILQKIQEENDRQEKVLKDQLPIARFDECVKEKEVLIRRLEGLDSGFQNIFNKIGDELQNHKEKYVDSISAMQALIRQMTELSVHIEATEKRNQHLVKEYLVRNHRMVRETKKSIQAVSNYYQSMKNVHYTDYTKVDARK